jgi:alanine-glyoxylate transaminase / serine-glyoxylate transaminase / serine-pyruvate transaminase
MKAYESGSAAYFATPPVNLIYAFHVSLKAITQGNISIEERFRLHREASRRIKQAAFDLGLKQVNCLVASPLFCEIALMITRKQGPA